MSLSSEDEFKGIKNEWNSEQIIPYIKGQLAEIRNNALKVVEEAFSGISDSKSANNMNLIEVEKRKGSDLSKNTTKENTPLLKCSQLELLKFLQYSNDKLSKYNIGIENISIINS
ncbi:uncharacterized protein ELE39_000476 [Cryptosporidium sp. chipmunk genotype I]|uniref:uncharacterized protein n=1 Tax=Cryptosporidium sp. chipmunk genotype I TaxID=1280935 RepID=UPI00351A30CB|nr:hypothetical protein ELE39_000476 [Cryptosporidium sp. chipmunk genotype I]